MGSCKASPAATVPLAAACTLHNVSTPSCLQSCLSAASRPRTMKWVWTRAYISMGSPGRQQARLGQLSFVEQRPPAAARYSGEKKYDIISRTVEDAFGVAMAGVCFLDYIFPEVRAMLGGRGAKCGGRNCRPSSFTLLPRAYSLCCKACVDAVHGVDADVRPRCPLECRLRGMPSCAQSCEGGTLCTKGGHVMVHRCSRPQRLQRAESLMQSAHVHSQVTAHT